MNHASRLLRAAAAALCALPFAISTGIAEDKPATPASLLAPDPYIAHIRYLASDELTGRAPGTPGSDLAADYIAAQFKAAGCEPAGVDGTWFQPFDVTHGKALIEADASLVIDSMDRKWQLRRDWIPFPFSEMADVEGPLAFAGYCITAEQEGYDDFTDFDAHDKILLVFRYEPLAEDPEAKFGGEDPSRHSLFVRKARIAVQNGAKALLVVNPPLRDPDQDELYEFTAEGSQQTYSVPMVHITRAMADAILTRADAPNLKSLEEQLDRDRKPLSRDLGLTVKLCPGLGVNKIPARNVLARLPGDGNTPETIVVGAHRDHLGLAARQFRRQDPDAARRTPLVHNGADDNASGTAGILELARVLAAGPPLRRNILFIAFDAEEMGLLGSRHFVENPTIPLENIKAMVNFDMIGRLDQHKYVVFGVNSGDVFADLVKKYAEPLGLDYRAPRQTALNSDHASFLRHDIPAVFVFTGVHRQYHQPEDDWELIDAEGATQVLRMWQPIITDLANLKDGPAWTASAEAAESEAEEPGDQPPPPPTATQPSDSDSPPARGGMRVRLGIVPDMAGDAEPGLVVADVNSKGAAEAAGIRAGDRILRIGDEDIRDIYAYMRALQSFEPGQEVDVVVQRGGEKLTLRVKLQASDYGRDRDRD